jgi:hypothetical protein
MGHSRFRRIDASPPHLNLIAAGLRISDTTFNVRSTPFGTTGVIQAR